MALARKKSLVIRGIFKATWHYNIRYAACNLKFEGVPIDLKPLDYLRAIGANTKKIQRPPDTFSVSSLSKGITHNEERPTIDINDLFGEIMKSINSFAGEIAEQRSQETGRDPENGGKNAEDVEPKEKRGMTSLPKQE
jgi:hypothetical protein